MLRPAKSQIATDPRQRTPPSIAVHCRDVTKVFRAGGGEVWALRGVNLDVLPGELLMLVGPSGCGKTTLISVIAGILDATAGVVRVLGEDLSAASERQRLVLRRRNVGFVFQQFNLLPTLTLAENVAVPLLINGRKRREATAKAAELLDRVGLGDRVNDLPAQLSGGQQQRVAIARALIHEPRLIVADEPTSALDHATGAKVMELLRAIALADRRSLVIVTHDARIFEYGDRIAHMDDGRVVRTEGGASSADDTARVGQLA